MINPIVLIATICGFTLSSGMITRYSYCKKVLDCEHSSIKNGLASFSTDPKTSYN